MASRTISQIFNEIITEKETFSSLDTLVPNPDTAQTFLDDLTSGSKVAIWRLIFWVCAFAIFVHEQLFVQHVLDIESAAKAVTPAVLPWYAQEAKKFQFGDTLVYNEETRIFEYADSTSAAAILKQIITYASARDISGVVTIKLAKTVASVTQKLTAAEKASFNVYLSKFKIAGTSTLIITDDPDSLKIAYTIEYDPQLITSAGVLISDGTTKPIQVAIDDYISVDSDKVQGLPFDGTFRVQDLTDAIQGAVGVVNAIADVCEASFGAVPYVDILAVNTEDYVPNSGYLATVTEAGSETVPIVGDINDVSLNAKFKGVYNGTGVTYLEDDFVTFNDGNAIKMYKANTDLPTPNAGTFDLTKWETVSNLTFVST